jgi:antitoxin component YwqK of YwqJK toxin-antitoxin module
MNLLKLITFSLLFVGCSNKQRNVYDEKDYILLKVDTDNNIIFRKTFVYKYDTGRKFQISYWDNGNILVKGFLYNNKLDGKAQMYDMHGALTEIDSFSNGRKVYSKSYVPIDTTIKIFRNGKLEPFTTFDSLK